MTDGEILRVEGRGTQLEWGEGNLLGRLALKAMEQVRADEREACAKIADDRAMSRESKVAGAEDEDEEINLRSLAWQFSALAAEIRMRSNVELRGAALLRRPS